MADVIHKPQTHSIYERTDYLAPLNMAVPFALARSWRYGVSSEIHRRSGLPELDRRPQYTPLVLHPAKIPKGK